MIRLTDEEITQAVDKVYPSGTGTYQVNVADIAIAKTQLKRVAEWGDGDCPHTIDLEDAGTMILPKRSCKKCWQSLLDEVPAGGSAAHSPTQASRTGASPWQVRGEEQ